MEGRQGAIRPAPTPARSSRCDLAEIALKAARTGGPIGAEVSLNAQGAGPGFGAHICDVEVDQETGQVTILRYTAVQDVGKAIHPSYVEGQIQGGAAQGIGWALNEEYIYDKNGQMDNPGFLDYRCPVASDLPMIEAVLVEVPNPRHPFGARGVGEVPIVPPMAAVANAIRDAIGLRMPDLPMSPPKVRAALDARTGVDASAVMPQRRLISGSACQRFTGGRTELEVEATTFPPAGAGAGAALSRPGQAGRGRHGGRHRRRDLPGRLFRAVRAGQRDRADPEDRRRLNPASIAGRCSGLLTKALVAKLVGA